MVSGKYQQKSGTKPLATLLSAPQFFSEKVTSLEFMDMHIVNINHFNNQYLVQISLHLSQINEACFLGF
jgi:hypothetical protein